MSKFVFRNNTIERFFGKDYSFSGYDDISCIPSDADVYIWWYQLPVGFNDELIYSIIESYIQKLSFVLKYTDVNRTFVILTMEAIYSVPFTDDNFNISKAISLYNNFLYNVESSHSNVKIIDIREFTRDYSSKELLDWKYYFLSQMPLNPKLHKEFKVWWEHKMDSIALKRKKCLVLDCDNTLWGGILGEDGIDGIKIGGDYPGKAFKYFQEALLQLSKTGVILAVCSKNNENDVFEAWEKNPYMILRKDNFSAYRINWVDKATNVKEIAAELNIGLDSFVFIDDNPSERELIQQVLPMVCVPKFPEQPYELPIFFKNLVDNYFKVYTITEEDKKKTEQYKANAARAQAMNDFDDFDKYLENLDMKLTIEVANDFNIPRIAQMTQKTNQFNLTTKRYTDADIHRFIERGWKIWCLSVSDKFGDNGITGALMINGNMIDTFLLSCRILGKGIETVFLKRVMSMLKKNGYVELKAKYIPSSKNIQVKDFYETCGFECTSENEEGEKEYKIELPKHNLSIKNFYNISIK